jgi:nucleoside-diphosphate-sugar epimerase
MKVLVTGAAGFVGTALCAHLQASGLEVVRAVRFPVPGAVPVGEIGPDTDWRAAMSGAEGVVHLAARVHLRGDRQGQDVYRRVNKQGTQRLAAAAIDAGVRRFVFLSSIKVNGDASQAVFTERDPPAPRDAYGQSKWEAEQALREACSGRMQLVILRPPLVYGPGVRANFLDLLHAVAREVPLPLGAISNRRSLLYLGNLVDAITVCLQHPAAANRLFLLSDGEDVSTPELVQRIARALKVNARLWPVPAWALRLGGAVLGRSAGVERLVGSLQADASCARTVLGWAPPFTLDQGLEHTAQWYRERIAKAG